MTIKAGGRAALIIAAGLWIFVAGAARAAVDGDGGIAAAQTEAAPGAPVALSKFRKARQWKHAAAHRGSAKLATKASRPHAKTLEAPVSQKKQRLDLALKDDDATSPLPASVANAHAQLADADASPGIAAALSSQARDRLQLMAANQPDPAPAPSAEAGLVEADQLNDLDRALSETKNDDKEKTAAAMPAMTVTQAPAAVAIATNDDSAWSQTSLIGKIFIAFGGLLTLASAARMFMA